MKLGKEFKTKVEVDIMGVWDKMKDERILNIDKDFLNYVKPRVWREVEDGVGLKSGNDGYEFKDLDSW